MGATASAIASVLADQLAVEHDLVAAYDAARAALDGDLFDKVRFRVAMLLGCEHELADDPTGLACVVAIIASVHGPRSSMLGVHRTVRD